MTMLLDEIEAFIGTHEIAPTRFGEDALGDRHFVRQLRDGRRIWPETEAKVRRFMATYRPTDRDAGSATATSPTDTANHRPFRATDSEAMRTSADAGAIEDAA